MNDGVRNEIESFLPGGQFGGGGYPPIIRGHTELGSFGQIPNLGWGGGEGEFTIQELWGDYPP